MPKNPIAIRRTGQKHILATFARVADAMLWKAEHDLGAWFRIIDRRPDDDPGRREDMPSLAGVLIRDSLLPEWRRSQFDRLLDGSSNHIPARESSGLEGATAVFTMLALTEAGSLGWRAVCGEYHDPALGPPVLRTNTNTPVQHAWVEHESGVILDLTDQIFDRLPVTVLRQQDDRFASFGPSTPISDPNAFALAAAWIDRQGSQLIPALRHCGAGRMVEIPAPLDDESLEPSP